jgi:hypothetical protein
MWSPIVCRASATLRPADDDGEGEGASERERKRERERERERETDRERRTCGERDDEQPGVLCQDPCSRNLCIAFRLKSCENGGVRTEQRRQLKDGPDRAREGDGVRDRSVAVLIIPTTRYAMSTQG